MAYTAITYLDAEVTSMYGDFSAYLNNPTLTKMRDTQGYSVYIVKTYCLLSNMCRYIVVMVGRDAAPVGATESLANMEWICLQTRTMHNRHAVPSHDYRPTNGGPLAARITRSNVTDAHTEYTCSKYPVTVCLLHTATKKAEDYQEKGTMASALETYETIVTLRDHARTGDQSPGEAQPSGGAPHGYTRL